MKQTATLLVLFLGAWALWSAPAKTSKAAPKVASKWKAPAKGTAPKTASKWKAPAKGSAKTTSKWSRSRAKAPVARSYAQNVPSPDRYREIQQALADKGYYKSEVNGQWGTDSIEAMRQFQRDQNLDPSGKLDSLTLIALGLGPKRTATAQIPKPQTQSQPTQQ